MKKWILSGITVLAVLAVVLFIVIPKQKYAKMYHQAEEYYNAEQYEEAAALFKEVSKSEFGEDDSNRRWTDAMKKLAEAREAEGDWAGAVEAYAPLKGYSVLTRKTVHSFASEYVNALIMRALDMARNGDVEGAIGSLDDVLEHKEEHGLSYYDGSIQEGKARVYVAAEQYGKAEEIYENLIEEHKYDTGYRYNYEACLYEHSEQEKENGNEVKAEELLQSAIDLYGEECEYAPVREAILIPIKELFAAGRLTESASEVSKISGRYYKVEEMQAETDRLKEEITETFLAEGEYEELYRSQLRDRFKEHGETDRNIAKAYYLCSTDRGTLADQPIGVAEMLKAWPADRELTAADMIRDLNYAEGEPEQQVLDACRFAIDYAKDVSLAADFLSLGMDLKAGGSYEGTEDLVLQNDMKEVFPSAEIQVAKAKNLYESVFIKAYGKIKDFRATEPRPGYYVVVSAADSVLANQKLSQGKALMDVLSEYAGNTVPLHAVEDPNTASFLLILNGKLRGTGTYGLIPVMGGAMTEYYGYTEDLDYELWDTVTGKMIASEHVDGPSHLTSTFSQIPASQRDEGKKTFWVECSKPWIAEAKAGAEELKEAADNNAQKLYNTFTEN